MNPVNDLNKLFESRVRLGIMSVLMVRDSINYNELKDLLGITDGNLASHIKALEENKIVLVHKGFVGKKTNTIYSITPLGQAMFKVHLSALEKMIKATK